jgi:hypothetical protein
LFRRKWRSLLGGPTRQGSSELFESEGSLKFELSAT